MGVAQKPMASKDSYFFELETFKCVLGAILKYTISCYHPVTTNYEHKLSLYSFYLIASVYPLSIPSPP